MLELDGSYYCGSCKVLALKGRTPVLESAMSPSAKAKSALMCALVGYFCFSFILGPAAIVQAIGARKEIRDNVMLTGWGKANAALVLGIVVTLMAILNIVGRASR
jgi:hypothetical protein